MGTAALVLGILALLSSTIGGVFYLGWIGAVCGVIAIILGAIARKDPAQKSNGTAGMVCGIISFTWGIVATIACVACLGAAAGAANSAGLFSF